MRAELGILAALCIPLSPASAAAQTASDAETPKISLSVPAGAPLRLYLTKRVSKRAGAPVEARLLEPLFAFDREVAPAGTVAQGSVSRVQPVGKWQRVRAIVSGDFTPLRSARVEFHTLVLPDGRRLSTQTVETLGLNSIYKPPSPKKKAQKPQKPQKAGPANPNGGILGTAKQTAKDRLNGAVNARTQGIADLVRGPDKKEKLIDLLWSKLPYHPQYMRRGMRFDAPLREPLQFGFAAVKPGDLAGLGLQPPPDSVVHARLLKPLSSASAKQGEAVEAVLTAPLFSADRKLVLPEGSRLEGTVVLARRARSFHRGGQLRFSFQRIDLPPEVASLMSSGREPMRTQAALQAAEGGGSAAIKVDSEGGVQAKESKTRFLAPVLSLMVANRSADADAGRNHAASGAGPDANVSGRTMGGGLGLGMLGAAVSQSSPYVGMAFGYYGLAWSVYSNLIARGGEVEFGGNAMMDIKFGARTPPPASKFRAAAAGAGQQGGLPRRPPAP